MGQLVAAEARKAGDEVGAVLTSKESELTVDQLTEKLRGHDVAIDFSVGEAVLKNVEACARARCSLVEGTTGWKQHEATRESRSSRNTRARWSTAQTSPSASIFSTAS